jgi:uncharacterized protein (DUF2249 family)
MRELDVRTLPPPAKHNTVHRYLAELHVGDILRIVNGHDPRPLRYVLDSDHPGGFTWTYVESGPHIWRVDILKTADFETAHELELLADTQALSVSTIEVKAGTVAEVGKLGGTAALIFCDGEGDVEISARTHRVSAGAVEVICPGELCRITPRTDLHAYVIIAKDWH